jgi:hypothetical protein
MNMHRPAAPKQGPTWKDLAVEVRSLSDREFKACWQKRFLAPIRNIEKDKALPGFVKLFLEQEQRNEWRQLRDVLACCLEELEGRVKRPNP